MTAKTNKQLHSSSTTATSPTTAPISPQYELQQISTLKRESTITSNSAKGGHNSFGMTSTTHGEKVSTASIDRNRWCFCSLRVSTIAILVTMFTTMLLIFVAVIAAILVTSFNDLERSDANATSKRFLKAVGDELKSFYKISVTYSSWNDMNNNLLNYRKTFTDEQMDSFMEAYFNPFILKSTNTDFVVVYSTNGSIVRSRVFQRDIDVSSTDINLVPNTFRNLPQFLINNSKNPFYKFGGFIRNNIDGKLILFNISPVTPTVVATETIPTGMFLEGRYLDTTLLLDLAKTVQSCVSTHIWSDTGDAISNKFRDSLTNYRSKVAIPQLDDKSSWFNFDVFATGILSQEELDHRVCWSPTGEANVSSTARFASYELIGDVNGDPLFISRVDTPRDIHYVGLQTLLLAIFLLFGVCIFATVVIIVFIERRILYRVSSLTRRIQDITGTNDAKQRIDLFRKDDDEIGLMVRNINGLLTSLDNLLEEAKEQEVVKKLFQRIATVEETTKNIMNAIKDIVITIGVNGNVLYANTSFYEQFGYSQRDVGNSDENQNNNNNSCLMIGAIFPDILNTLQNTGSTSSLTTTVTGSNTNTITNNYQFNNNNNITISTTTAPVTTNKEDINANIGNIYTHILKELEDNRSHFLKGVTKNHKDTIDFECIITKTYIVLNGVDTIAYVLVGRKMSNRLSSSSLSNTVTEEEEEMLGEFDKMLLDEHERLRFKEFCKNEKSEENILFIESVLEYKALKKPHERMIKQEYILNTFLANATLLNLSDEMFTREVPLIRRGIGQVDLFDNLLIYVETIVCKDTYMRFKQQQTHLMYL
ncbi:hypothetical protein ABK040_007664 [Willaertia magna]